MSRAARQLIHACILSGLCLVVLPALESDWIGYRGPGGTGIYPKANPPTSFKQPTWTAELPNWGNGHPVAINGKVFVTCEPWSGCDWPVLFCFDQKDGTELWRAELNHLPAVTGNTKEIAESWRLYQERYRLAYNHFYDFFVKGEKDGIEAKFTPLDMKWGGFKGFGYGQLRNVKLDKNKWKPIQESMKQAGLSGATWQHGCGMGNHCFGQSFATPITDGESVWVATAFGGFFCYDFAGKLTWLAFDKGKGGEYCRNGRSPIIYGDLFISDIGNRVRAFDKKTGKLAWAHDNQNAHEFASPVVVTIDGKDFLMCAGIVGYALPSGKSVPVEGWKNHGGTMLTKYDEPDVVFYTGGGEHGGWENKGKSDNPPPAAVRWSFDGSKLNAKVLWSSVEGNAVRMHSGIVYHEGKLYHKMGAILDPATGKVVKGAKSSKDRNKATPATHHLLQIAGKHLYGLKEYGKGDKHKGKSPQQGRLEVFDLNGGKKGEGIVSNIDKPDSERAQTIKDMVGLDQWQFSYSCPFTFDGGKIFIRGNDALYCIGK